MLKDIKTKEHRAGAELPKTLRHAPKELAKKGLLAAKEKGKEQLLQAAQNGMGGADQAASEESAGAQLLRKTGERGREVASSGGNMLCRAPGRKAAARRAHRLGDQEHAFSGHGGPLACQLKEKSPGRPRTQQGAAHGPRAGKPAVKAARQPVKTPQAIHTGRQQAARTAKQAAQRAKQAAGAAKKTAVAAGRALANTAGACITAAKSLVAALAAGGGLALFLVLLVCLIALVAGSAFGIFFSSESTGKGITLKQAVQTLNEEYYRQLKAIEAETAHDRVEYIAADGSVAIPWEDVLAVFAADMAADEHGQQVVVLGAAQLEQLRAVLADMYQVSHSTRTAEHEEEIITTDEDGNEITEWVTVSETILEIRVSHKTTAEMAAAYGFTPRQNEQLTLLSDPQLWIALSGM